MLVLTRKRNEDVVFLGLANRAVRLRVVKLKPNNRTVACPGCGEEFCPPPGEPLVKLGINAPDSVRVLRSEHPDAASVADWEDEFEAPVVTSARELARLVRAGGSTAAAQRRALISLLAAVDDLDGFDVGSDLPEVALLR